MRIILRLDIRLALQRHQKMRIKENLLQKKAKICTNWRPITKVLRMTSFANKQRLFDDVDFLLILIQSKLENIFLDNFGE